MLESVIFIICQPDDLTSIADHLARDFEITVASEIRGSAPRVNVLLCSEEDQRLHARQLENALQRALPLLAERCSGYDVEFHLSIFGTNGMKGHYTRGFSLNASTIALLARHGYSAAVTITPGTDD